MPSAKRRRLTRVQRQDLATPLVWLYASFADGIDGGNPAGVVASTGPIDRRLAQSVAAVMSVPTTGFAVVGPGAAAGSPVNVRFFTPEREIDACGHVTVALAVALVESGVWEWGRGGVVRARGGDFPLRLRNGQVEIDQQLRVLEPAPVGWSDVEAALGQVRARGDLALEVVGTGLRHLVVPLADPAALAMLTIDAGRIGMLAASAAVDTVCVWAPTVAANRFRVRDLCAAIGAVEEPASGTTAAALALYLAHSGQLVGDELVVEQGVEMGRPSRIDVSVRPPVAATVRGTARKVLSGTLTLPIGSGNG
ncbi:MAG TPA: PhzF family phenazine biosynthesis isomerase [Gaiellaceae bacterium]|nr:PhzF family phenazine biosynthesis isomerase [Gaiellaceae bacterium]